MAEEKTPFVFAKVDEACHLCWLVDRIEHGGGPLEIGLCYAVHTGAAAAGGAAVPICDRHQHLIDVTAQHMMEAMHPDRGDEVKTGGLQ